LNLDRAIELFDLESYVTDQGGEDIKGHEWIMDCPICGKRKLAVHMQRKSWHCFFCQEYVYNQFGKKVPVKGAGGLLALIELVEGCTKFRAVQIVMQGARGMAGGTAELPEVLSPDWGSVEGNFEHPEIPWPPGSDFNRNTILTYCASRGITVDDIHHFGLFGCVSGTYANRLIFPCWEDQKLKYFQARAMWSESQQTWGRYIKTLNPPNLAECATATEVLFNLDIACQYPTVVITEGPIDAIHVGYDAVATFGKTISPLQILKLKRKGVRSIILMWDGPSRTEPFGAWKEMFNHAPRLAGVFPDVRLVFLPQGDPGEYPREALRGYLEQAVPYSQFSKFASVGETS